MARIRTIKPEFFTSLTVASLPVEARLTFIGLWTHVDDEGRCVDDARLIKAAIWPLDDRLASDVELDLRALSESSLIRRYKVGERSYLAITNWREHQKINRPTRSKLPAPPPVDNGVDSAATSTDDLALPAEKASHHELTDNSLSPHDTVTDDSPLERNREQGTGNRGEREGNAPQAAPREPKGTRIPDDFEVTPAMRAWFREHCPGVDGPTETAKFRDYWRAQPGAKGRRTDWEATWRNWMRKAAEDTRRRPTTPAIATGANRHIDRRDDNPFRGGANATYASTTGGTR